MEKDIPLLLFDEVSFGYNNSAEFGLKRVSGALFPGQHLVLIGASGSGKSTLVALAGGYLTPKSGQVYFKREPLAGPESRLVPGHEDIVRMPQHIEFTARLNFKQQLLHELKGYEKSWATEEADRLLALCGLLHLSDTNPINASGGEQQRLALALALCRHPDVLLLDEPLNKVDPDQQISLAKTIRDIATEENVACLWVLHQPALALTIADEIWVMANGVVVEKGSPTKLFFNPVYQDTAKLLGPVNVIDPELLPVFPRSRNQNNLLRPSQIKLTSESPVCYGRVVQSDFYGAYYLLEVQTEWQMLVVQTNQPITIGATVGLAPNN
jgi:ABC-type cobalamin/Fe3+-siderophores transport system ATPase subunit